VRLLWSLCEWRNFLPSALPSSTKKKSLQERRFLYSASNPKPVVVGLVVLIPCDGIIQRSLRRQYCFLPSSASEDASARDRGLVLRSRGMNGNGRSESKSFPS